MQTAELLVNHLKHEIESIQLLNALLSQERELLVNKQYQELEAISHQKIQLSAQLEQSAQQRMQLINPGQLNADPKQILQDFLASCSQNEADQIHFHHQLLAEQLTICQERNSINGQVIAVNMHSRQELVNCLTGKSQDALNVYNSAGNIESSGSNKHYQEV